MAIYERAKRRADEVIDDPEFARSLLKCADRSVEGDGYDFDSVCVLLMLMNATTDNSGMYIMHLAPMDHGEFALFFRDAGAAMEVYADLRDFWEDFSEAVDCMNDYYDAGNRRTHDTPRRLSHS